MNVGPQRSDGNFGRLRNMRKNETRSRERSIGLPLARTTPPNNSYSLMRVLATEGLTCGTVLGPSKGFARAASNILRGEDGVLPLHFENAAAYDRK